MIKLTAGQIVIANWRDALPKEANKLRPAIVVEDDNLFDDAHMSVILVPLTEDSRLAIPDLSVFIDPTSENGCSKPYYAAAHSVTATSVARIKPTASYILPEQLTEIRQKIAIAIGLYP
jgi:mRNA-degrading endonuclease toxin of MazEF toxin-antitoxin module